MLIYLGLSALATFVAALILALIGQPPLPAIAHLVFAVGILPLIVGAMTHFVPVLTRSSRAPRHLLLAPLLLQLAGWLVFLDFCGDAPVGSTLAAAAGTLLIAGWLAGWMVERARRTLGRPHPGWRWYLAAIILLGMALMLVPAMTWWPEMRPQLRLLHLHLNTLGFIGLSALGTLQVLLPTALHSPDADAARRLRQHLPVACSAVLMIAVGAVTWRPLALAGAVLLAGLVLAIVRAFLQRYGWRTLWDDGAAAALSGALFGFLLLAGLGAAHGLGTLDGRDAVSAFVVACLLPLVTGALTQLLPVWLLRGKRTPRRDRLHAALRCGGALRTLLFVSGGFLLGLGLIGGIWPALLGILHFVLVLLHSLATASRSAHRSENIL